MGLGIKLNPSPVTGHGFLMVGFAFAGMGLGWQNLAGLCPLPSLFWPKAYVWAQKLCTFLVLKMPIGTGDSNGIFL
jgi:hypothetical protein